ncbi:hypothetical protein B0H13DRAFT_2321675 [Mycena leptocephala]|nr:hypothetical protein B0H13DRAFT_2321675 [Mycena leptocephala]
MATSPFTLNQLATEILFEIASNATQADHVSLSLVSRAFNSVATHFVYRHIELTSFKRVVRCCTTLANNSKAALAVRTFALDIHTMMSDGWDASMFAPFLRMINAALLKATHLRSLVLRLPPDPQGVALERCTFPFMNHYASNSTVAETFWKGTA